MAGTTQLDLFGEQTGAAPAGDAMTLGDRLPAVPLERDENQHLTAEPPPPASTGTAVPAPPPIAATAMPSPLLSAVDRERERVAHGLLTRISSVAAHMADERAEHLPNTSTLLFMPLSDAQLDVAARELLRSDRFGAAVDLLCLHIVPDTERSNARPRGTRARAAASAASSATIRRSRPSVGEVVVFGDRPQWYALPPMERVRCVYATPTTVRVCMVDGHERTVPQQQATALPDGDATAWEQLHAAYDACATALAALAAALVALGHYPERLRAACAVADDRPFDERSLRQAPNPLTPTVVIAPLPPDVSQSTVAPVWQPWSVPSIKRRTITRHTPRQLVASSDDAAGAHAHLSQSGAFCCADDAAWHQIVALHEAAENRRGALATMLSALGTYAAVGHRQDKGALPRADTEEPGAGVVGVSPAPTAEAIPRDTLLQAPTDTSI